MAKLVFVLGGAKSGKSAFAEGLARYGKDSNGCKYKNVAYVATAEGKDQEMAERISYHRKRRPKGWRTVESPIMLKEAITGLDEDADVLIIDCVTLYITNLLMDIEAGKHGDGSLDQKGAYRYKFGDDDVIIKEITALCDIAKDITPDVIMVSNEIGLSIVPENRLARIFRDIAGRSNQIIAQRADEVYFITAGIAQRLK